MQILRKECGEDREWRGESKKRGDGKKWGNSRHKAQVKPGYEWGTYRRKISMNEVQRRNFLCTSDLWQLKKNYKIANYILIKHVTISAQRRWSEIEFNEPRQPSWSIFDASADTPPPPPMLHSSCQSTNSLRGGFLLLFALNFLFARLWKSESLKWLKRVTSDNGLNENLSH